MVRGKRKLGRRRRRLYWTIAIVVAALLAGTAAIVAIQRANRPETYRTGEDLEGITRKLDMGLPEGAPDPKLVDVTETAGLSGFRSFVGDRTSQLPEDMGCGAAWGDYDRDGDDDLFLVSAGGPLTAAASDRAPSELYENLGDGTFARVDDFPETRILGMAAAWGDYDGDGWLDLVVSAYGNLLLFRNEEGRLTRSSAIPDLDGYWAGVSWADFDNDDDLDLYVCGYVQYYADDSMKAKTSQQYGKAIPYTLNPASYEPATNLLFRNRGDGTFYEVAGKLGVSNPEGRSLGALWNDFDEDGRLDLYVANDISDNAFYMNREDGFEEIGHAAWVADYRGAMGLAAGDWNRDGDDDLFVSHWIAQENALYDALWANLEERPEAPRFMDVADQRGLGQIALQVIGWGSEFADFDGDGWLDLVVANGSTFETEEVPRRLKVYPAFLFWNRQGEHFHDLAPLNPSLATPRVSRGLTVSDYDLDGDLDLLIVDLDGGVRLLANEMQSGNWIQFRLSGGMIEGARIVARVGELQLRRSLSRVSYLSQSSLTLHVGLGAAARVDSVEVHWPGGETDRFEDLAAGTIWELGRGETAARTVQAKPVGREALVKFWNKQRAAMNAMKVELDCRKAIGLFEEALAIHPEHEDSLYYLGNCMAERGDLAGAYLQLEKLMQVNPMSHRAYKRWGTLRAVTAESDADLRAAVEKLERAVEINREAIGALQVLGEIDLIRGDLESARRRFEWVCRTNSRSEAGQFFLAYLAWKDGDENAALAFLEKVRMARGEDYVPKGGTAEGDVRNKMHSDPSPLLRFVEAWDGEAPPSRAFAALDTAL